MLCKVEHVNVITRSQGMIIPEIYYTQFHMAWCLYIWGNVTIWGFKFFGFFTPRWLVNSCQSFGEAYCFHFHILWLPDPEDGGTPFLQMLFTTYQSTWRNFLVDLNLCSYCCQNPKFRNFMFICTSFQYSATKNLCLIIINKQYNNVQIGSRYM
jgi:hypothetical protein